MKHNSIITTFFGIIFSMISCNHDDCANSVQDGTETGIDCGGDCPPCSVPSNNFPNNNTSNSTGFIGIYNCVLNTWNQNVPCTMTTTTSNDTVFIVISDGGAQIDPDIELKGIEGSTQVDIIPCDNGCYQGDMGVASGGTITDVNGKKRLYFGVYTPPFTSIVSWMTCDEG